MFSRWQAMNNRNIMSLFISIVIAMLGFGIALTVLPFYIESMGGGGAQFGILLLGMVGLGSTMLFLGLAGEIWMLYVAQVGSGILSSAMFPVAVAYISGSGRSGAMGIAESYMGVGRVIGPLWAGYILDLNIHYPYLSGALFL